MKLAKLQKHFADHLYNSDKKEIFDLIDKSKVPDPKRLQIYRNNVFGNFDHVLEMIYPAIKNLVGEDYFEKLSQKYHQKYRSKSGNLDDYGQYFPALISSFKKEHQLFYLKDLAKLEWFYHKIYFAKDAKPIDLPKLQKLKSKEYYQVKFRLHPSCYLLHSQYPIYSIWNFALKNSKKKINIAKKPGEYILAERSGFESNIHNLTEEEYLFLQYIKKKNSIYQIYKILSKKNPNFDIGALIGKYISIGVLSGFDIK